MIRPVRTSAWAGVALVAAMAYPALAQAGTFDLTFSGPNISGALAITFAANPNTGLIPSTPLNTVDPIGSYVITGVSGTFSDTTLAIANAAVTGVVPLNKAVPETGNDYAPASFSLFVVKDGVPGPGNTLSPGLHYDNLFYPGGSPRTAGDYPFSGGYFDIYGLLFTLDDAKTVNLWSNGNVPGTGLNYGVAVTDGLKVLDYTGGVAVSAVPLPATAPLFGAALLGLAGLGYGMKRRAAKTGAPAAG